MYYIALYHTNIINYYIITNYIILYNSPVLNKGVCIGGSTRRVMVRSGDARLCSNLKPLTARVNVQIKVDIVQYTYAVICADRRLELILV